MIPESVSEWCRKNGYGEIIATHPVGGGCINHGMRLETSEARSFFLKTNSMAPADMFAREANGLLALAVVDAPRVPEVFLFGKDYLLLEDVSPAPRRRDYWVVFGRQLAGLHNHTSARFGFDGDNYIGSSPQPNTWTDDGHEFFAVHRLLFQARLAGSKGRLGQSEIRAIERIAARLTELTPSQPASLIHGDLWSGNAITDSNGYPAIIDPAVHYGWAEAELAMTTLFGSFPKEFYYAYLDVRTLPPGMFERFPIYNLYHLINHLNLFGSGYLGEVQAITRRFG